MNDVVITLSSSDEEESIQPPRKRVKLTKISNSASDRNHEIDDCIVLLDDEDNIKPAPPAVVTISNHSDNDDDDDTTSSVECLDVPEKQEQNAKEQPLQTIEVNGNTSTSRTEPTTSENVNETTQEKKVDVIQSELSIFLDDCIKHINAEHRGILESKVMTIRQLYENVRDVEDIDEFKSVLEVNSKKITTSPEGIAIWFKNVYEWLKCRYQKHQKEQTETMSNEKHARKLYKLLMKLIKRIKVLEEEECDWNDDGNSSYVKLAAYKERAVKVNNKLCQYLNENPHQNRLLYYRLDFSKSQYSEINKAINRKYKNHILFPTYFSMDKLIRKCVKEKELDIPEDKLRCEIKMCFESLGNLIQRRRGLDLYEAHSDFITELTDPAKDNPEIEEELRKNRREHMRKEKEVLEKYARLQETGVEPELSSDSDKSKTENSDSGEN